jgi:hypothetical protein
MSSGGTTQTNTVTNPWSGQQPYLQNLFSGAQNAYDTYSSNPSSSVAGFTPMQQQAMGNAQGIASGTNMGNAATLNNSASGYVNGLESGNFGTGSAASALSSFANGGQTTNPYEQGMANAANTNIINAYQTATAPQTTSQMEGSGRYGSGAAQNAQNMDQQGLATQLANAQNNLYGSLYQTNQSNALNAASTLGQQQLMGSYSAPSLVSSINGANSNLYNMGGNQQALNQSMLSSPFSLLGQYGSLIGGNYGGSTTSTQPYYNNTTGEIAGGLGDAALMGAMFLSDRRLKQDIEPTGARLANGLPLYRYRYLWDQPDVNRVGVMADEVRAIAPHAVHRDVSGFDKVNYAAIGAMHVFESFNAPRSL